jgi:hypothetical protein
MRIRSFDMHVSRIASPSFCDVAIVFPFACLRFPWLIIRSLRLVAWFVVTSFVLRVGLLRTMVGPFENGPNVFNRGCGQATPSVKQHLDRVRASYFPTMMGGNNFSVFDTRRLDETVERTQVEGLVDIGHPDRDEVKLDVQR